MRSSGIQLTKEPSWAIIVTIFFEFFVELKLKSKNRLRIILTKSLLDLYVFLIRRVIKHNKGLLSKLGIKMFCGVCFVSIVLFQILEQHFFVHGNAETHLI